MSDVENAVSDSGSDLAEGSIHGDQDSDTGRRFGPPDPRPTREGSPNNDVEPDGQPGEANVGVTDEALPPPPNQSPALRDRQATK